MLPSGSTSLVIQGQTRLRRVRNHILRIGRPSQFEDVTPGTTSPQGTRNALNADNRVNNLPARKTANQDVETVLVVEDLSAIALARLDHDRAPCIGLLHK